MYEPYAFSDPSYDSLPPTSTRQQQLETSLVAYYNKGIKCIPLRLYRDKGVDPLGKKICDFGASKEGKPYSWRTAVLQLDQQVDRLRRYSQLSYSRAPANAIAILTGPVSNLLVIDVDNPTDRGEKWMAEVGWLIPANTLTVRSPSGGLHFYFKWDQDLEGCISTLSKAFGNDVPIDIRGEGGLIFGVPSAMYDRDKDETKYYLFDKSNHPSPTRDNPPPKKLVEYLLNRKKERTRNIRDNTESCKKSLDDLTEAQRKSLAKVREDLKEAPVGQRSGKCYGALIWAIKLGMSEGASRIYFSGVSRFAEDDTYFDRVWPDALRDADVTRRTRPGTFTPQSFKSSHTLQNMQEVDAKEVLSQNYDYLLQQDSDSICADPILRKGGITMLCGSAGQGKTILSTNFAIEASKGNNCWYDSVSFTRPQRVLYIQGDLDGESYTTNYLNRMRLSPNGTETLKFVFFSEIRKKSSERFLKGEDGNMILTLLDVNNMHLYRNFIEEAKPDIVVIDSLSSLVAADQNDRQSMTAILTVLKTIASQYKHSVLLIHHYRKFGSRDKDIPLRAKLDDVLGSQAAAAMSDCILGLQFIRNADGSILKGSGWIDTLKEGSLVLRHNVIDDIAYTIGNDISTPNMDIMLTFKEYATEAYNDEPIKDNNSESSNSSVVTEKIIHTDYDDILDAIKTRLPECKEYSVQQVLEVIMLIRNKKKRTALYIASKMRDEGILIVTKHNKFGKMSNYIIGNEYPKTLLTQAVLQKQEEGMPDIVEDDGLTRAQKIELLQKDPEGVLKRITEQFKAVPDSTTIAKAKKGKDISDAGELTYPEEFELDKFCDSVFKEEKK